MKHDPWANSDRPRARALRAAHRQAAWKAIGQTEPTHQLEFRRHVIARAVSPGGTGLEAWDQLARWQERYNQPCALRGLSSPLLVGV